MLPTTDSEPERDIMTLRGAAYYLNCHPQTIRRLLAERAIPAFQLGSNWRFRRSDLDKWIDAQTVIASESEPKRKGRKRKPKPSPR